MVCKKINPIQRDFFFKSMFIHRRKSRKMTDELPFIIWSMHPY